MNNKADKGGASLLGTGSIEFNNFCLDFIFILESLLNMYNI